MSETDKGFTLRQWLVMPLSLTIWLLSAIVIITSSLLGWWSRRVSPWIVKQLTEHFYWPFVQIRRVIEGKPRWLPFDLKIGKQPRTDAERAAAELDPHVQKIACLCPDPECINKKQPTYVYNPFGKVPNTVQLVGGDVDAVVPDFLKEAQQAIIDNAAKASDYDKLAELTKVKDETIAIQQTNLAYQERTISAQTETIRLLDQKTLLLMQKIELLESKSEALRQSHVVH